MTTAPVLYEGHDLPLPIQRAITRVMDPSLPIELTACERVALAALLRRVEARDGTREFWVLRCNLAEAFNCVDRTITNWLCALERKGLISKEQGRTRWGNYKSLTLRLSDAVVQLLGLGASDHRTAPAPRKEVSRGHKEGLYQEQSLSERQPAAPRISVDNFGSKIPEDCEPLLGLRLGKPAIFKLMGLATRNGKRLGDIVAARLTAIKKADDAFALLRTLATDGIDYGAVLRQERQKEEVASEEEARRASVEVAKEAFVGCVFQLREDMKATVQNGYVDVAMQKKGVWQHVGAMGGADLISFWERVASRALVPVCRGHRAEEPPLPPLRRPAAAHRNSSSSPRRARPKAALEEASLGRFLHLLRAGTRVQLRTEAEPAVGI